MSGGTRSRAALALDRAVGDGAWDTVMVAMNRDWAELLASHPESLSAALEALPEDVVDANPRWAMARTYVSRITKGEAASATRYRHSALPEQPVALMDALAELTSRSAAHRAAGRFDEAAALAAEASARLVGIDDEALRGVQPALPEFYQQWGMSKEFAGDFGAAIADYTDSYDHAVLNRHPIIQLNAAGSLAWIHMLAGRGAQAATWLGRLPVARDDDWWTTRHSVPARLAEAYRLIDDLRIDEAREFLAVQVDVTRYPEYWAAKPLLQSLVARDEQEAMTLLVALDARLADAPAELTSRGTSGGMLRLARSALLARGGSLTAALRELDDARVDDDSVIGQLVLSAHTCLDLLAGEYSAVSVASGRLRSGATDSPRVLATALIASAIASLRQKSGGRAADDLRSASVIATTHGVLSAFVTFSRADLRDVFAISPDALSHEIAQRVLANGRTSTALDGFGRLTPRETAVVGAVLSHSTVAGAAAALFVSPNTVKTQLRSIYAKLGVGNRAELQAAVARRGSRGDP